MARASRRNKFGFRPQHSRTAARLDSSATVLCTTTEARCTHAAFPPVIDTPSTATLQPGATPAPDVVIRGNAAGFLQQVESGRHQFKVDEPLALGGTDAAATPYDLVLAALGSCTSMTVGLYARKKRMPLESITVSLWHSKIHAADCEECETREGRIDRVDVAIELTGALSDEQRARLLEIAKMCPVHRTLTSEINVRFKDTAAD